MKSCVTLIRLVSVLNCKSKTSKSSQYQSKIEEIKKKDQLCGNINVEILLKFTLQYKI